MSDLKLFIIFLIKSTVVSLYVTFILFTAVHQVWIITFLLSFLPLFIYYLKIIVKLKRLRKSIKNSEKRVKELAKKIEKSKIKNRGGFDE